MIRTTIANFINNFLNTHTTRKNTKTGIVFTLLIRIISTNFAQTFKTLNPIQAAWDFLTGSHRR
jgi:hypothetical protein